MSTAESTTLIPYQTTRTRDSDPSSARVRGIRGRLAAGALSLAVAGLAGTGYFVSREPGLFDPLEVTMQSAPEGLESLPPGAALTGTVIRIADTLLSKTGGFLSNDVMPPFSILDNMPSWEYGVLTELRDTVRAMRNDFGRAQSQSVEDPDLVAADAQFHFSPESWMLPSSEDEYRRGAEALTRYLDRLLDGDPRDARFFARADNLNFYLATVEKRLGNLSQRLSASANLPHLLERGIATDSEDPLQPGGTAMATRGVGWMDADNVFYEARGYLWALTHTLRALERDYAPLLAGKAATLPMHEIILKLELAQQRIWSPVILTSSGFGVLTNHSLVLASYISRANAAIIDLRRLLVEG